MPGERILTFFNEIKVWILIRVPSSAYQKY